MDQHTNATQSRGTGVERLGFELALVLDELESTTSMAFSVPPNTCCQAGRVYAITLNIGIYNLQPEHGKSEAHHMTTLPYSTL